jgi:hypothetical protein
VKLQCTQTAHSDEYSNTTRPVTALPLPHNSHLPPASDTQTDIKDFSYLSILQKDPLSEFFLKKEPGYRLGGYRVHILRIDFFSSSAQNFQDPPTFCFKQQEARGYTQWVPFFSEKAHITQGFFKKDHFKVSFRKNPNQACFTWRDLKKQEGFRVQPWNAQGLVDMGPTGFLISTTTSNRPWPSPWAWQERRDIKQRRLRVE